MNDMYLYIAMAAVGYIFAAKFRSARSKFFWTGKVQTLAIVFLVLAMGMRMGSNEEIISNIATIGLSAFFVTVMVQVFSILGVTVFRKLAGINREGFVMDPEAMETGAEVLTVESVEAGKVEVIAAEDEVTSYEEAKTAEKSGSGLNSMTFIILICVAVGMLAGYFVIKPLYGANIDAFADLAGLCIKIGLCVLIFFVGTDLGFEGTIFANIKNAGLRVVLLPIAILCGTLVGAVLSGLVLGLSVKESLAIGAGLGWYSLAPGIILEAGYVTASAISFLHNVFREIFSILLAPLVAAKVGAMEPVGLAGSPAMDVCLPIIEKASGAHVAVYSFISGAILSFLVPILVPLFIGL